MFRRGQNQGQGRQNRQLPPEQMAILQQANQLMAAGSPGLAAPLFAQLAGTLEAGNRPRRAANMHAAAAHAFADSQAGPAALDQARGALNLFIQYQMAQRTPVFYANITRKLNAKGMTAAAGALQQEYGSRVGPLPPAAGPAAPGAPAVHHGTLPTSCPKCGGPVHGREANWVDDKTAECDYCGALIRAED